MTANFAQTTPDENLSTGWNVQGTGAAQSTSGKPGVGYSVTGVIPASPNQATPNQVSAGYPSPPGAANVANENSGSGSTQILENPGYASAGLNMSASSTTNVTTAGVQSPFGLNAQANLVLPVGVTAIYVCPFQASGQPAGTAAPWVQVWAGTSTAGQVLPVSVPPAGYTKTVGANATSASWTPTN